MTGLDDLSNFASFTLKVAFEKALLAAANQTYALFKRRVFQLGEDANNNKIGSYRSKSQIKKRQESGRQTQNVDFTLTGSLFGAVQLEPITSAHYQIRAIKSEMVKIRGYEKRTGKVIGKLSVKENAFFEEELRKQIKALLGK